MRVDRSFRRAVLFAIAVVVAFAPAVAADVAGHWEGAIEVPGQSLGIEVDFTVGEDGALAGTIAIPMQNLRDFALADIAVDGEAIRFRMPGIPGDPSFNGTVSDDGSTISGPFTQGGQTFSFELRRGPTGAETVAERLAGLDAICERAVVDYDLPGLAVAVVHGDEVVFAKGFGKRDLEGDLPMTPDSLFAIGSTTKAMTSTLLGMLVDDGKLDWDEPLTRYLPGFRLADPMITARITPRDLVTHRSGMPRHDLIWYNNQDASREEIISRLEHLELTADLRETFQYNNLMYMTAGYLAGKLSGTSWEQAVRERLFEPLGMTRTNFSVDVSAGDPDHALPYRENDDGELEPIPFRKIDMMGPAGSVNSSVREMARWLSFNLVRGEFDGRRLIQETTLADIHTPQMVTGGTPERPDVVLQNYGMGWMIGTYRGHRWVAHGGGIDGFVTSVVLLPDDDLGIVAFDNRASGIADRISRHAADLALGLDSIDWVGEAIASRAAAKEIRKEAEERKQAARVEGTSPSHPIADYAGTYENPGYGDLTVSVPGDGTGTGLTLTYNGIEAPLEHLHYDVWRGAEADGDETFENQVFVFHGDAEGRIAALESVLEVRADPIVFRRGLDAKMTDPEYLARFAGTYFIEPGQRITIELSGDVLRASVPGQPTYTLEPVGNDRFVLAQVRVVKISFEAGEDGTVVRAMFDQPGGIFEAKRVDD